MRPYYADIIDKLGAPVWWTEGGVPRYCPFTPDEADVYAEQVALVRILCQSCRHPFLVCYSSTRYDRVLDGREDLETYIRLTAMTETLDDVGGVQTRRDFGYGDPPNINCCAAGPTMTAVPDRILEFWRMPETGPGQWQRASELEVDVTPSWSREDDGGC